MQTAMTFTTADRCSAQSLLSSRSHKTLRLPIPFRSNNGRTSVPCRCSSNDDQSGVVNVQRRSVLLGASAAALLTLQSPALATDGNEVVLTFALDLFMHYKLTYLAHLTNNAQSMFPSFSDLKYPILDPATAQADFVMAFCLQDSTPSGAWPDLQQAMVLMLATTRTQPSVHFLECFLGHTES